MTTRTATPPTRTTDLRTVLRLDAAASGALGVLAAATAGVAATPLGLPAPLLVGAGLFLVAWAAGLLVLSARRPVPRGGTWTVIAGNSAWVLLSAVVAVAWPGLTGLGVALVLAQAVAVVGFVVLQTRALRRR